MRKDKDKKWNDSKSEKASSNMSVTHKAHQPTTSSHTHAADDLIWKLSGLHKHEFYAAAYFLNKHEKRQGRREGNNTQAAGNMRKNELQAGKLEKELLDIIALFFARLKGQKEASQTTVSAQHVTATALRQTGEGLEIWIAKNDGAQVGDEKFREKLQFWFQKKVHLQKDDAWLKEEIEEFWTNRLQYYEKEARRIWKQICQRSPEVAYKNLIKIYLSDWADCKPFDMDLFDEDWNDAKSLLGLNPSSSSSQPRLTDTESALPLSIGRQLYETVSSVHTEEFWKTVKSNDIEGDLETFSSYQTDDNSKIVNPFQMKGHPELALDFNKLVKYIRFWGTVERALPIFIEFRKKMMGRGGIVRLEFLPRRDNLNFGPDAKEDLEHFVDNWSSVKVDSVFTKEKVEVIGHIKEKRPGGRYFHCELQLLDEFLDDINVYDYFGCSKLSCFMCWGILRGTPYRTRDTHAKVYIPCAFPFSLSKGNSRYQLILALKKVQDYLVERVLRRALDPDDAFSDNVSLAESIPPFRGPERFRGTYHFWWREPDGRNIRIARTRAIRIPSGYDEVPVSELVDFDWSGMRAESAIPLGSNVRSWSRDVWRQFNSRGSNFSRQVSSEIVGEIQKRVIVHGCSKIWEWDGVQTQCQSASINNWCLKELRDSGVRATDLDNLLAEENFRWRGDLYLFRVIGSSDHMEEKNEFDYIDEEELLQIVQSLGVMVANTKLANIGYVRGKESYKKIDWLRSRNSNVGDD